ncbi:hypothetical protein F4779DRAFT_610359 [Xylariaceae sp. FL0662B]|nr:hypothetical protein F4779DRAFT_610359 [Xylariaceae sp. FL0662B]
MATPTIFVTGTTGTQGGAVARLATKLGWTVHTTVRNPESQAAKAVASLGVKVTQGDWDDAPALKESIAGCDVVFLNLYPDFTDFSHELRQAQGILAIAKAAGVRHIIYSSVVARPKRSTLPPAQQKIFDESPLPAGAAFKTAIENEVMNAGFQYWTILRPACFMANFLLPKVDTFGDFHKTGVWSQPLPPATLIPLIDHEDIAKFAVASAGSPEKFHGQRLALAGELRTVQEIMDLISSVSGKKLRVKFQTDEEFEKLVAKDPILIRYLFMRDQAQSVDVEGLKTFGIEMTAFVEFLRREKKLVNETYDKL